VNEHVCAERRHIYETHTINLEGFEAWFYSMTIKKRQKIQRCISEEFSDSMKLLVCCHDASRNIISFIARGLFDLFNCPTQHPRACHLLNILLKKAEVSFLFRIIDSIKICHRRCPIELQDTNLPGLEKRQFDIESLLDNFRQFVCGANRFIDDLWSKIFTYERDEESEPEYTVDYLRFISVFRKPVCCVLADQLRN
jgi:hypothetical protein